ncbi:MAG: acyltransferase [Bacteroidales bacterium]|nr:acyltransferase [Bacteroidales bacterium]
MVNKVIAKLKSLFLYPFQFKHFGKKSRIDKPLRIEGKRFIEIEDHVYVQPYTWLACQPLTCCNNPTLKLGEGTVVGNFNHIYATQSIVIENYVLTADKVYISDNLHGYDNPEIPILQQPIRQIGEVRIGEGSWLGENVCVIGASIGKHCTIGANSVVTHDIPDYCVAVGAPARVIKQYNFETKQWEKK